MPKFFPGATHAIVKTPKDKDIMARLGGLAVVRLCFTNDEDFIIIKIRKMDGPTSGVVAVIPCVPGTEIAAIQGKIADEAKMMALIAFDKVKQKYGLKFGKQYKVLANDITEIVAACQTS